MQSGYYSPHDNLTHHAILNRPIPVPPPLLHFDHQFLKLYFQTNSSNIHWTARPIPQRFTGLLDQFPKDSLDFQTNSSEIHWTSRPIPQRFTRLLDQFLKDSKDFRTNFLKDSLNFQTNSSKIQWTSGPILQRFTEFSDQFLKERGRRFKS